MTKRPRNTLRLVIREDADVAIARLRVREMAPLAGLSAHATHELTTAVSEVARNIVVHATSGELTFDVCGLPERRGLIVTAVDRGPGIADPEGALRDGHSTAGTLGLGLSSARRLVDEFELTSGPGGTIVTLKKWGP